MRTVSGRRTPEPADDGGRRWPASWVCAAAGLVLFHFFGNATRGYIDTASTFWWWISQWLNPSSETEHGWLILAISAWLLGRNLRAGAREQGAGRREQEAEWEAGRDKNMERRAGKATGPSPQFAILSPHLPALAAMVTGLGLHALGFVAQQTRISIVALLLFTWGVLRLGGGRRWGAAAGFPLAFMVFAIPVNVLDSLGFWLRLWVVDAAGVIAQLAGLELTRSGTQLFSADGSYQYDVAAACSGVRSLVALSALSLLIGYLQFRSPWRRGLMLALCFPLTYLGNVVRIAAIIFAAQLGGQAWGERAHDVMGFGVFVIVLGGVLLAARLLERVVPEPRECHTLYDNAVDAPARARGPAGAPEGERGGGEWQSGKRECHTLYDNVAGAAGQPVARWVPRSSLVVAVVIVGLVAAEMAWFARVSERPGDGAAGVRLAADGVNPVELPAFVGTDWIGRRAEVTAVERAILPADTGYSRRNYVHVQGGAHAVYVSIVLSGRDRTSIHRPEVCLVGQGWTIREAGRHAFAWPEGGGTAEAGSSGENVFAAGLTGRKAPATVPATLLRTETADRKTGARVPSLTAYWFVNRDVAVATHWERFFHDAWNRVRHGRVDRWAYVLVQADAVDGEAAALARMQTVLNETLPVFQRVR